VPVIGVVVLPGLVLVAPVQETKKFFPENLKLSAPTSAATSVLGIDPSKVEAPTDLSTAALSIVNSFDTGGRLKTGFAFSNTLGALGLAGSLSWSDYNDSREIRIRYNTRLSVAAVKGVSEDDPSSRVSFGIAVPLVNETDWRTFDAKKVRDTKIERALGALDAVLTSAATTRSSFSPLDLTDLETGQRNLAVTELVKLRSRTEGEMTQRVDKLLSELNASDSANMTTVQLAEYDAIRDAYDRNKPGFKPALNMATYDEMVKQLDALTWNRRKIDFAAAATLFQAGTSDSNRWREDGTYLWLTYADALGANGQMVFLARYLNHDRVWDSDKKVYVIGGGYELGARFKMGSNTQGWFAEGLYTERESNRKTTINRIFQLGYEAKVGPDQWIQVSAGDNAGSGVGGGTLFGFNYSFNFSSSPALANPK
jgi:hypothetical protein